MGTRAVIAATLCLGLAACFGGGGDDTAGEAGAGALPGDDGSGVEDGDETAALRPVAEGAGAGGEDSAGGSDVAGGGDAAGMGGEAAGGGGEAGGGADGGSDAGGGAGGVDGGAGDAGSQDAGGRKADAGGRKADAGGSDAGKPAEDAGVPDDAVCSEKDTCTHCVHETAPESEADCSCPLCPVYAMPSSRCAANTKAFNDVCAAWLAKVICPVPLCVLPPELACVDGTCSELAPEM